MSRGAPAVLVFFCVESVDTPKPMQRKIALTLVQTEECSFSVNRLNSYNLRCADPTACIDSPCPQLLPACALPAAAPPPWSFVAGS